MDSSGAAYGGHGGAFGNESYLRNNFTVREGTYRNVYEYTRPTHAVQAAQVAASGSVHHPVSGMSAVALNQSSIPVRISVVNIKQTAAEERFPLRICFNVGREVYVHVCKSIWAPPELNRPLDKQLYKGPPTCHDLNARINTAATAASPQHQQQSLNLLIGFFSGCVIYCDPVRKDITRLFNEDRIVDNTKITCVKWLPPSSSTENNNLFLAAHASGNVFVYNTQLPWVSTLPPYTELRRGAGYAVYACKTASTRNPIAKWTLDGGGINDMAFSPCGKYLAFARRDGVLQVFEWSTYELVGASRSYFGGLLCCAWSYDSKFVAVAGEDDLVHVWSLEHCRIIARCRGHKSWVSRVAWDPCNSYSNDELHANSADAEDSTQNRPDFRNQLSADDSFYAPASSPPARMVYRFASVGQDTQLCIWELTEDVINQVLFPSKARNSFVIPASSELLKQRGGKRFAFRAAKEAKTKNASGGSGSSSLASSTRSSAVAANVEIAQAASAAAKNAEKVSAAPVLVQSGRKFRFPLSFMRRSSPAIKPSGEKAVIDDEIRNVSDSARENDSNSTLQGGEELSKIAAVMKKKDEIGSPSSITIVSDVESSPFTGGGGENISIPVARAASASYNEQQRLRRRSLGGPGGAATDADENDDDDDDDNLSRDGATPLQLMSDGEILERHSHGGERAARVSIKNRAVGGALSVDGSNMAAASLSLPSHGKKSVEAKKKQTKRRQFSLLRFAGGGRAVEEKDAGGDGEKKFEPNSGSGGARVGRRVAASLFGSSINNTSSSTTTTTTTTDFLGGFATALNRNRFNTPECPRLDEVPMLEPVICKSISTERLTDVVFLDECMLIATQDGTVQVWGRPEFLLIAQQQQQSNHDRRLDSISSRASASRAAAVARTAKAAAAAVSAKHLSSSRTSSYAGSENAFARTSASPDSDAVTNGRRPGAAARMNSRNIPNNSGHQRESSAETDDLTEAARYGQTSMFESSKNSKKNGDSSRLVNGTNGSSNHVGADDDDDEDDELIDLDAAGNRTSVSRARREKQQNVQPTRERGFLPKIPNEVLKNGPAVSSASRGVAIRPRNKNISVEDMSGSRDSQSTLVNSYPGGDGERDIKENKRIVAADKSSAAWTTNRKDNFY